jgi:hypothetical protein
LQGVEYQAVISQAEAELVRRKQHNNSNNSVVFLRPFFDDFKNVSLYQDRLGTNTSKALRNEMRFRAGGTVAAA